MRDLPAGRADAGRTAFEARRGEVVGRAAGRTRARRVRLVASLSGSFAGGSIKSEVPGIHIERGLNTKGLFDFAGRPKPAAGGESLALDVDTGLGGLAADLDALRLDTYPLFSVDRVTPRLNWPRWRPTSLAATRRENAASGPMIPKRLPATPVGNGKHTAVTAPTVAKKRPTDWRNAAGAAVNYVMRSH